MEGMSAFKNGVLFSFSKIFPANRTFTITQQLFCVYLQFLFAQFYSLLLVILLFQYLMQLMNINWDGSTFDMYLIALLLFRLLLKRLEIEDATIIILEFAEISTAFGAQDDFLARLQDGLKFDSAVMAPIGITCWLIFH